MIVDMLLHENECAENRSRLLEILSEITMKFQETVNH